MTKRETREKSGVMVRVRVGFVASFFCPGSVFVSYFYRVPEPAENLAGIAFDRYPCYLACTTDQLIRSN